MSTAGEDGVRLALFGGTFDPIHNAHLMVAREAADRFSLDRVMFVTAADPPHKTGSTVTSYEDRHRMVELACAADPRFSASRIEEGGGKSYSILTIERVKAGLRGYDQLYFLIGADAFSEIETWHRFDDVIRAVEFIVVTRPGHDYEVPAGARVHRLDSVEIPVSSSQLREQLARGEVPGDIPASVAEYILSHRLYGFTNF